MPEWLYPVAMIVIALGAPVVTFLLTLRGRVRTLEVRYMPDGDREPLALREYASRRYVDDRLHSSEMTSTGVETSVKNLEASGKGAGRAG